MFDTLKKTIMLLNCLLYDSIYENLKIHLKGIILAEKNKLNYTLSLDSNTRTTFLP